MTSQLYRSAFVPHDLRAPLIGASWVRSRGLPPWSRTCMPSRARRRARVIRTGLRRRRPQLPMPRRCRNCSTRARPSPANDLRRILLQRRRDQCALRHAGKRPRRDAFPAAPRPAPRPPSARVSPTSRSAATLAVRCAFLPHSTASMACGRPMVGSTPPARWRWHHRSRRGFFRGDTGLFRNTGYVLLDERRVQSKITRIFLLEDAFAEADPAVAESLRTLLDSWRTICPWSSTPSWRRKASTRGGRQCGSCRATRSGRPSAILCAAIIPNAARACASAWSSPHRSLRSSSNSKRRANENLDHVYAVVTPGTMLVLPTSPSVAPRIDLTEAEFDAFRTRVMRLTCTASLTGLPQMTISAALVNGCPAGLSFIGWAGGDDACSISPLCCLAISAWPTDLVAQAAFLPVARSSRIAAR